MSVFQIFLSSFLIDFAYRYMQAVVDEIVSGNVDPLMVVEIFLSMFYILLCAHTLYLSPYLCLIAPKEMELG